MNVLYADCHYSECRGANPTYNDTITERGFPLALSGILNDPWQVVILNYSFLGPSINILKLFYLQSILSNVS
jgi:hypothetical protein